MKTNKITVALATILGISSSQIPVFMRQLIVSLYFLKGESIQIIYFLISCSLFIANVYALSDQELVIGLEEVLADSN